MGFDCRMGDDHGLGFVMNKTLFFVFSLLLLFSSFSFATIAPTGSVTGYYYSSYFDRVSSDPVATCKANLDRGVPYAGAAASDFNHESGSGQGAACYFGKTGYCSQCYSFQLNYGAVSTCPTNSHNSTATTCVCNTNYVDQNGVCVGNCPAAGSVFSSGMFDYGTNASDTSSIPNMACTSSGCAVYFSGSAPAGRALVGGVYHYFAEGNYTYGGPSDTCTSSSGNASHSSTASIPAATCSSDSVPTVIDGVTRCVVKQTGQLSTSTPPPSVTSSTSSTTNADGTVTKTTTTTYGDGTVATTVSNYANGTATTPTSSSVSVTGGSTGAASQGNPGVFPASGTGSGNVQFPSDYAKSGESGDAAQKIIDDFSPKWDDFIAHADQPPDPDVNMTDFDNSFFSSTFNNLLSWSVPAHSSQCPTPSFSAFNRSFVLDAHCQLIADHFQVFANVMSAVWMVLALFIVLRA